MPWVTDIFAVVWCDFIPLSLPCRTAEEAVAKARAMEATAPEKAKQMNVRAVRVDREDRLHVLHPLS